MNKNIWETFSDSQMAGKHVGTIYEPNIFWTFEKYFRFLMICLKMLGTTAKFQTLTSILREALITLYIATFFLMVPNVGFFLYHIFFENSLLINYFFPKNTFSKNILFLIPEQKKRNIKVPGSKMKKHFFWNCLNKISKVSKMLFFEKHN